MIYESSYNMIYHMGNIIWLTSEMVVQPFVGEIVRILVSKNVCEGTDLIQVKNR